MVQQSLPKKALMECGYHVPQTIVIETIFETRPIIDFSANDTYM